MMRLILALIFALVASPAFAQTTQTFGQPGQFTNCPPLTGDVMARSCVSTITNVPIDATNSGYGISTQGPSSTVSLASTSSTTLAFLPGLGVNLAKGGSYICDGHLALGSGANATPGAKGGLVAADGRLTVTSMGRNITVYTGTTLNVNSWATALDATSGGAGNTSAVTDIYVHAAIVVNAAGLLAFEGAQNFSSGTTTNFLINSTFSCVRVG